MKITQKAPEFDFFHVIGDQADQVYFVFDFSSHQFSYLNAAFETVWKRNPECVLQNPRSILDTIHPEDRKYMLETYHRLLAHGVKTNLEFRIVWPDGSERWIRLLVYPIVEEEELRFAAGVAEDDSQRKKNFFYMQEINAKKNSTLEILSHDLKAPLGIIHSFASLIEKRLKGHPNPDVFEWIGLIQQTCQRSINLIHDFVSQEFLESTAVEINKVRLDLVWEIRQVIETYKKSEESLSKKFEFTYSHPHIYVEVDSMKFVQVINNLISNAIKFTHDQGIVGIHIEKKQPSDGGSGTVLISVRDNGIGIPLQMQPYLFDKFTKARRPGIRGEDSVGLGMSIIKTIVEWHKGKIWFTSEENKGTSFFIEIPRYSSQEAHL